MNVYKKVYTHLLVLSVLLISIVCIYWNSLQVPFQFDDKGFVEGLAQIHNWDKFSELWNKTGFKSRIVVFFTFFLNYHFHQLDVTGYHIVNIVVHVGVVWSLYWFCLLLFGTPHLQNHVLHKYRQYIAFSAALIFAVHPVQTQAVTYISQRFTSSATLFYLLSLCLYLKYREPSQNAFRKILLAIGFVASSILGMFCKEIIFTLPAMIILVELIFFQEKRGFDGFLKRHILTCISLFGILAGCISFWSYDLKNVFRVYYSQSSDYDVFNPITYLLTQFRVVCTYIKLLFFPVRQSLDYDFVSSQTLFEPTTFTCFIFLVSVFVVAVVCRKKNILISFGIFWFFLTLLVESSIIPIRNVIFEHRMYLPFVGFSLMLSVFIFKLFKCDLKKISVIVILIVSFFSVLTVRRNAIWQSEVSLWENVVEQYPNKSRAHLNLANAYMGEAQFTKAIEHYQKTITRNPANGEAFNNLGMAYLYLKDYPKAMENFSKAILVREGFAKAYNNRGTAFAELGQYNQAIEDYTQAVKDSSIAASVYVNRALANLKIKQPQKALDDCSKAISIDKNYVSAYLERARIYQQVSDYDLALNDLNTAIRLNSRNASGYLNRANLFSRLRKFDSALEDYAQAIKLEPTKGVIYLNRAMMYKMSGNKREFKEDIIRAQSLGQEIPDEALP